ncbi:MAG: 5-formyltetrahydrofolate cyclo-ligase [Planctomycetota bacterium]
MTVPPEASRNKPAWRAELKRRLRERVANPDDAAALAARFIARVPSARTVMLYAAAPEEAPTVGIVRALREAGVSVALPVVLSGKDHAMDVFTVEHDDEVAPDRFGIAAPRPEFRHDARRVAPERLDAVAVPGLGFDEATGVRLGRGAGYYDRFLLRCVNADRIGVGFDEQVVRGLPAEPHDLAVHAVVTPTRTLRFAPPK